MAIQFMRTGRAEAVAFGLKQCNRDIVYMEDGCFDPTPQPVHDPWGRCTYDVQPDSFQPGSITKYLRTRSTCRCYAGALADRTKRVVEIYILTKRVLRTSSTSSCARARTALGTSSLHCIAFRAPVRPPPFHTAGCMPLCDVASAH